MPGMRTLLATFGAGGIVAALGWTAFAQAQSPPGPPTFAYLYGRVTLNGANVSPEMQPVVAFVNGNSCGGAPAQTFVATDGDDVPDQDIGATVYVVDVLAGGAATYEREGCGHAGDPVILYFPAVGRMAAAQPLFQAGPIRADIELDIALQFRASLPQVATDPGN